MPELFRIINGLTFYCRGCAKELNIRFKCGPLSEVSEDYDPAIKDLNFIRQKKTTKPVELFYDGYCSRCYHMLMNRPRERQLIKGYEHFPKLAELAFFVEQMDSQLSHFYQLREELVNHYLLPLLSWLNNATATDIRNLAPQLFDQTIGCSDFQFLPHLQKKQLLADFVNHAALACAIRTIIDSDSVVQTCQQNYQAAEDLIRSRLVKIKEHSINGELYLTFKPHMIGHADYLEGLPRELLILSGSLNIQYNHAFYLLKEHNTPEYLATIEDKISWSPLRDYIREQGIWTIRQRKSPDPRLDFITPVKKHLSAIGLTK
ncbi:hypothetical protein HA075_16090 [bacterium BFN5]|nr:hypothetical protein HA075_15995 [bacterium BFN5]QJW47186.1 hypothetical protein HA075_16090 [bacterium BFN5]